jgi:hypothetical protein
VTIHEGAALLFFHGQQGIGPDGHAVHSLEHSAALLERGRKHAVHQYSAIGVIGQSLMRQQTGHPERRVRRDHTELGGEVSLKAVDAVQNPRQLFSRFVAKGIADDDEDFAVLGFLQASLHMPLVELVLIGYLIDAPVLQEARASRRLDEGAPGQGEMREVPADVDRFHVLTQRLEHIPNSAAATRAS